MGIIHAKVLIGHGRGFIICPPPTREETPMNHTAGLHWEAGTSRIPFAVYTDEQLHQKELERFFYKGHWCYVGLEAEVPQPGDFKRTVVGERSVILSRAADGSLHCFENVCAHRGMQFCRQRHGNRKEFVCPYHQWSYTLSGDLQGVPLRRGVRQDGQVKGGMPADFNPKDHGLTKLKVATRGGVVFASFDHDVEPLEDYLGPTILQYFDRLFDGRELKLLGYNRQRIPGNWKLMQENIKDPYHPGLLHTWFVTFGLWRADNKAALKMDAHHRHAAMISTRGNAGAKSDVSNVSSFKSTMELEDKRFLDIVHEDWWGEPTAVMTTIFPSVIFQQQVNSVSTRHIQPDGHGNFDFVWTHFGFANDTLEMTARRLRQANLFGPAGFVSADDGEAIELSQCGFEQKPGHRALAELGGRGVEETDHMVTETLIRGMYDYWRKVMEAETEPPRSAASPAALPPEGAAPSLGAARREGGASLHTDSGGKA
jgi:salicylate 5-hydroxylase large subunit